MKHPFRKEEVEAGYPSSAFYEDREEDLFAEGLAVVDLDDRFRILAARGIGYLSGENLAIAEDATDELCARLDRGERAAVPTDKGSAILFGDLMPGGLIPVVLLNRKYDEIVYALRLLGKSEWAILPPRKGTHPGRADETCQTLFRIVSACDRLFCPPAGMDFRRHCAGIAALAGCRTNVLALPRTVLPQDRTEQKKWTLFLLCLFLSLRGASNEGPRFRMREENGSVITGIECDKEPQKPRENKRFLFLRHPMFRDMQLERTETGWRMEGSFRGSPSPALAAVSRTARMILYLETETAPDPTTNAPEGSED